MTIPKKPQNVAQKRCQKCLTQGHWTYECNKPYKVRVRPSRTQILKQYMKTVDNGVSSKTVTRTKLTKIKPSKSRRVSSSDSSDSSTSSSSSSSSSSSDSSSSCSSDSDSDNSTSDTSESSE